MENKIIEKLLQAFLYVTALFAACVLATMAFLSSLGSMLLGTDFLTLFLNFKTFKAGVILGTIFLIVMLDDN